MCVVVVVVVVTAVVVLFCFHLNQFPTLKNGELWCMVPDPHRARDSLCLPSFVDASCPI